MAQNIYQGTGGNPFGAYNPSPILAGGQAMGQAFQSIGTSIASAMEKRRENQEKKEKEEALAQRFKARVEANPGMLDDLGVPNDPDAINDAANAFAKHPEAMAFEMNLSQLEERAQRMRQGADIHGWRTGDQPYRRRKLVAETEGAETDLGVKKKITPLATEATLAQLGDQVTQSKITQAMLEKQGGIPGAAQTQVERQNLATKKIKADIAGTKSLIDYRKAMAQANINASLAKVYEAQNPDASKTISQISSATTALLKQPVKVRLKNGDKVHVPLSDVLEGKVEKIDKKSESELVASYKSSVEGLNEKMRRELSRLPLEFIRINKETGEQEVVEGTFADKYAYDMAKAEAEEEDRLRKEREGRIRIGQVIEEHETTPGGWMYMRGK